MQKRWVKNLAWCLFVVRAMHLAPAYADDKPLWELGLGVGAVTFPAYRGSDTRRNLVLPAPYLIYRGDFLKSDRNGIRSVFFDNDRFDLNLSVSASIPVSSKDIKARTGMPDLKPTLELGPSLNFHLWRSQNGHRRVDLRLPARYAFTVETNPRSVGWQITPQLAFDLIDPGEWQGWNFGMLAGPVFGSRQQHAYFYSVQDRYATASRSAYDAPGGYAGWQVLAAVSKRFPKYWVGGFVRYDSLQGAVFSDSPLVNSHRYVAAGFAIAWILAESSIHVASSE